MSRIYCLNCGNEMESDTKFCPSCGAANTQYSASEPVDAAASAPSDAQEQSVSSGSVSSFDSASGFMSEPVPVPTPVSIPEPEPQPQYQNNFSTPSQPSYQQTYQQPSYGSVTPDQGTEPSKALAIVSLILGIVSLVCCCWAFGIVGVLLSGGAVVCGIIALVKKLGGKGMAVAGLICGGIALLLAIIMTIMSLFMDQNKAMDMLQDYYPDIYEQFEDSF